MIFYQNSNNIFPGHVSGILIFRALAVIYFLCPITYGCAGESEFERLTVKTVFFGRQGVTSSSVYRMLVKLEEKGFIHRTSGKSRGISLLISENKLPVMVAQNPL